MKENENEVVFLGTRTSLIPNNITHLEADINYTTVFTQSGKRQMISTTLLKVHECLSEHGQFVRISRKVVVNMQYVKRFKNNKFVLVTGEQLMPSRRRLRMIKIQNIA